ncbi:MAG: efflux RND transporter permease subunit [Gammaproteobacteria bacterium]|nr:efflux RND transporter permease subunit [Gammaproteobacteria bacterium]
MNNYGNKGGLARWSINHPVSVSVILMTIIVLGIFSLNRLGVDLLPKLIYPEVRIRILNPGVPAAIMEDEITRQLEEQLAITENATNIQSRSSEGRTNVDLSFPYGTDINIALRDASTRLDRAKRFLPTDIEPPVIYKRDPSQIPIMELIVSSDKKSPVELRSWVDYNFSKWFLNLPGVASTEVGGGLIREINITLDQNKLNHYGFDIDEVINQLNNENQDIAGGKLYGQQQEISLRALGRFTNLQQIANTIISKSTDTGTKSVRLRDVAVIENTHEDERLKVRLNGISGVKLSIQKQPSANTVEVVDQINSRLQWLKANQQIASDVQIQTVGDQSVFIRHSVSNATTAAVSGACLAMLVVYLFLGNLTRTLIIGSAIPVAILVTFIIMNIAGITLNIMTLGGLALGIGMLVDSTIVMLENISRHQHQGEEEKQAAIHAAAEVNSPIIASTSTNLVAVLPFLLIGGLTGLLFKELIITIAAAMVASLFVAMTVVPALGSLIKKTSSKKLLSLDRLVQWYKKINYNNIKKPQIILAIALPLILVSIFGLTETRSIFLPKVDEGNVDLRISTDGGTQLAEMNRIVFKVENLLLKDPEVDSVYSTIGGFVFGRSAFLSSNRSSLRVQLKKGASGQYNSEQWVKKTRKKITALQLTGVKVRLRLRGVRGVRLNSGDDDISIRVRGQDISVLTSIGNEIVNRIKPLTSLQNIEHFYEDSEKELVIKLKREITSSLSITASDVGRAARLSLDGLIISDYIEDDQQYNIRLRYPKTQVRHVSDLNNVIVAYRNNKAIYLGDVAEFKTVSSTKNIYRDKQQRFVEVSASLDGDASLEQALEEIELKLADYQLPDGYTRYQSDDAKTLQQGQSQGATLLLLALFLVFVVMAIQYESFLNPFIILLTIPFAIIGVMLGIFVSGIALSMSVWLGMVMLAGIVVNNAIVMVEQIEIEKSQGMSTDDAIINASAIRLKPILMTTLTTAIGMAPLAMGFGEGSEMLQPLAIVTVFGLSFSMLVSLFLLPVFYKLLNRKNQQA